jgi:hypothetical protein
MSETLKKKGIPIATIGAVLVLMAPMLLQVVLAAPRIHGPINCDVTSDNALECTFNVSGLD